MGIQELYWLPLYTSCCLEDYMNMSRQSCDGLYSTHHSLISCNLTFAILWCYILCSVQLLLSSNLDGDISHDFVLDKPKWRSSLNLEDLNDIVPQLPPDSNLRGEDTILKIRYSRSEVRVWPRFLPRITSRLLLAFINTPLNEKSQPKLQLDHGRFRRPPIPLL